ncbi:hypothetical protein FRC06_002069 [Ceratobasidium sp. 370]|nr:hypothetical protein FRC06_002069 [Ceratobasidium sp. 370]
MPLTTAGAAVHLTPTVIGTFCRHYQTKIHKLKHGGQEVLTDDILFDEAFHVVKAFVELGTHHTVDDLQSFTNTHVPSPFWTTVIPTRIPLSSCNDAADLVIKLLRQTSTPSGSNFSDEEADAEFKRVVGGERWWQVRGLDGIEAEWVAMKDDWENISKAEKRKERKKQRHREHAAKRNTKHGKHPMEDPLANEEYTEDIDNLTRVMLYIHGGAYFWGSITGDSAGGALALTLLTIIRDTDLPMPSGAVLISPWVDLTHSFDSVMTNGDTDIIPPHGFIHKPSALWPVPARPPSGGGRAPPSQNEEDGGNETGTVPVPTDTGETSELRRHPMDEESEWVQDRKKRAEGVEAGGEAGIESGSQSNTRSGAFGGTTTPPDERHPKPLQPQLVKVPVQPGEPPLELRSQIQVYATNEQLTHPLVSPVLHGSLGGLCPLYIIAGDGEVLRDEIIYLAHRAADPASYPLRDELLARGQQRQIAERWTQGTPVHLQVFDGMCHVLTVFTFTAQIYGEPEPEPAPPGLPVYLAKLVYRQVANFVRHLTTSVSSQYSTVHQAFPSSVTPTVSGSTTSLVRQQQTGNGQQEEEQDREHVKQLSGSTALGEGDLHSEDGKVVVPETTESLRVSRGLTLPTEDGDVSTKKPGSHFEANLPHLSPSLLRAERVSIHGKPRPLSPDALRIPKDGVGVVKPAPVKRWLAGQDAWDAKYKRVARSVEKERAGWEKKAMEIMRKAGLNEEEVNAVWRQKTQGAQHGEGGADVIGKVLENIEAANGETDSEREERMRTGRRWGPLDLAGEIPPPSAIAGRLDTPDAVDLLKTSLAQMPRTAAWREDRGKTKRAVDRILHNSTEPVSPRRQGPAEQQVPVNPLHGVRMWGGIMAYFVDKTSNGTKKTKETLSMMSNHGVISDPEEDPASRGGRLPLSP